MVSTLDSESSDPSSNLGGTCFWLQVFAIGIFISVQLFQILQVLDSLVVRISACHVEGPGSIPGRGENFFFCAWKKSKFPSSQKEKAFFFTSFESSYSSKGPGSSVGRALGF